MRAIAFLCLPVALYLMPACDDSKEDLRKMQGDWVVVSMTRDGLKIPDDDAQALFRNVKDDTYTVTRFQKKVSSGTLKLDATKQPKHIDAMPAGPKDKARPQLGIYAFEGARLKLCFALPGAQRPDKFDAAEGTGYTVTIWEPEKK